MKTSSSPFGDGLFLLCGAMDLNPFPEGEKVFEPAVIQVFSSQVPEPAEAGAGNPIGPAI